MLDNTTHVHLHGVKNDEGGASETILLCLYWSNVVRLELKPRLLLGMKISKLEKFRWIQGAALNKGLSLFFQ